MAAAEPCGLSDCCIWIILAMAFTINKYPTCLRLISDTWKSEKEKCDELDREWKPLISLCILLVLLSPVHSTDHDFEGLVLEWMATLRSTMKSLPAFLLRIMKTS